MERLFSEEFIEKAIISISTGRSLIYIDGVLIIFKQPSNYIKQQADAIYEIEFEKAKEGGLLEKSVLEKVIEDRSLFTEEDKSKLSKLESRLEGQRVLLSKTTRVRANQERIKKVIDDIEFQIRELTYKKTSKLMMSAEVRASEERSLFLCWKSVYKNEEDLFWNTFDGFRNTNDLEFRSKIFSKFIEFYSGYPLKTIRYIARNNLWRIRYLTSQKTSDQLFGVPTTEYSNDMLGLAYWSNYYDNIYQMMPEDRPSDLIINDDEALDAYMQSYYEERNREAISRRSNKKTPGKLKAFDSEEVIVTASNELWRDIDYDKPREAQKIKGRADVKKRTKFGKAN